MGKRAFGQRIHQLNIGIGRGGQQRGFQRGGNERGKVVLGVAVVAIFGGEHFALLGDADLPTHAARRLRQNGLVRWPAATPHTAAAPVEQADADVVLPKQAHQANLGLV